MAILFDTTKILLTDGTYTLSDVYNEAVSQNKTQYISKIGNSYEIKNDLFIGESQDHPAFLEETNVNITILGDLIQIFKGSHLKLGNKRDNGTTNSGCSLSAPNIKLVYGFGNSTTDNAGDIFLYNSIIKVRGFWAFFRGQDQIVEVIDCLVDGFGRIEGANSILKNITFEKANGRYGILSPKGELKTMENLSVGDSEYYQSGDCRCAIYFNPNFVDSMRIVGGTYQGYDELIYTETNPKNYRVSIEIIDANILNGYTRLTKDNKSDMYIKNTFNPICKDENGNKLMGVNIVCKDKYGSTVFDTTSDENGSISEEITYIQHIGDNADFETMTPHTIDITYNDISLTRHIVANKPIVNFPLYITAQSSSGSGGECDLSSVLNKLNELETNMCNCVSNSKDLLSDKINTVESGLKQVIANVVDEVNENETYFKETGFRIII